MQSNFRSIPTVTSVSVLGQKASSQSLITLPHKSNYVNKVKVGHKMEMIYTRPISVKRIDIR